MFSFDPIRILADTIGLSAITRSWGVQCCMFSDGAWKSRIAKKHDVQQTSLVVGSMNAGGGLGGGGCILGGIDGGDGGGDGGGGDGDGGGGGGGEGAGGGGGDGGGIRNVISARRA